jgi:serine protease Do
MNKIKKLLIGFFALTFVIQANAKDMPGSFADLAERLMPSVVNISTTTTVKTNTNPFPGFQFPPGSPFEDMFKNLVHLKLENLLH